MTGRRSSAHKVFAVLTIFSAAVMPARVAFGQSSPGAKPLVIGVLSYETGEAAAPDSTSRNAERGLRMGIDEARETARLFGRDVKESRTVIRRGDDASKAARIMARTANISALLVTNPELVPAAESLAHWRFAVIVMRTLPAGSFECGRFNFAIYPPVSDLAAVTASLGEAHRRNPSESAALWNSTLQRFGALELNDRFRTRWKTGMTSEAWASWAAVKILSEAALRTQSNEPFKLLDYITKSEFDGHKGWPLTFRASDHYLRQPFYIVSAERPTPVLELPGGGRSDTESAAAILDRILGPHSNPACTGK